MADRKRFQNQTLNSEDYEKTEKNAKSLKNGGEILGAAVLIIGGFKKYGPVILKTLSKIRKR